MQAEHERLSGRIDDLESRTARLEQELRSFRDEYRVTVEEMRGALRFNVPVHFAFDDATVREQDRPVLDRFARIVQQHYPNAVVTVEGFADPAGPRAYNLRLGQRRAEAVRDYLVKTGGLDPNKVRAVSYGEDPKRQVVPGAKGPGPTGIENRRVALVIDYAGAAAPAAAASGGS